MIWDKLADGVTIAPSEIGINQTVSVNDQNLQAGLGTVYFVAGIVCVVVMIIGGVRYAMSQGDAGNVQSAKNTILYGVIGLVVILSAAAVTQLIFTRIGK